MRESIQKHKNKKRDFKLYKSTCQNSEEALNYLKLHKNCPYGRLEYAIALDRENKKEEARKIFEDLLDTKNFKYALSNLLIMEYVDKNFDVCYGYLNQLEKFDNEYFEEGRYRYLKYFCMQALNIPVNVDYNNLDYIEMVILNYNRDIVINHIFYHNKNVYAIKNKIVDFNEMDYDESFFADSIDIIELYDDISAILKLDEVNKSIDRGISSKIYFRYDNVGSNIRGKQNYLVVMNLTHTDKIISMYPNKSIEKDYLINKNEIYDFFELKEKVKKHYRQ